MQAGWRQKGCASVWEPASLLPAQCARRGSPPQCGELRLVAAVFEEALRCILRNAGAHCGRRWREFEEAQSWFKDDRRDWPFAFANVCEFLALDASAVRAFVDRIA